MVTKGENSNLFWKLGHLSHIDSKTAIANARLHLIEKSEGVGVYEGRDMVVGHTIHLAKTSHEQQIQAISPYPLAGSTPCSAL